MSPRPSLPVRVHERVRVPVLVLVLVLVLVRVCVCVLHFSTTAALLPGTIKPPKGREGLHIKRQKGLMSRNKSHA